MHQQVERRQNDTQIEQLVENAVRHAFEDMFEMFGTDVTTQQGRQELRADMEFTREARKGTAFVRKTALVAVIGTFVTGAAFGLWSALMWVATHIPSGK